MIAESIFTVETESNTVMVSTNGYSSLLQGFGISYKSAENYWQVGEIKRTQGWIVHITAVLYQIEELLILVIPYLKSREISFKIIQDEKTAEDLLNGNLGLAQIGKIVSIYPEGDASTLSIAKELISLTGAFKGPFIPTDICLGNIVYTRYGSFNPIIKLNAAGQQEKYILDEMGNLIKDAYEMPFRLPQSVTWPFDSIIQPSLPEAPALLNRIYKPIELLKTDPKGNVFRGLYVKGLLRLKKCVIKQGFRNMHSDRHGRDIRDRLMWQYELHKALMGTVPLPSVYDLFEEKGYTVLVMELIKGVSLYDKAIQINPLFVCWEDLELRKRQLLMQYVIDIAQIILRMHQKGYVHRDIVPVNFMVDKNDQIRPIDIELTYSLNDNSPNPPFTLGTYGFMSPEQEAIQRPTTAEDIYGFGATVIYLLTGIFPVKFNTKKTTDLAKSLQFFINDDGIAALLAGTVHEKPTFRPSVPEIVKTLVTYRQRLSIPKNMETQKHFLPINGVDFQELISVALQGLTKPPIIIKDNLWCSKLLTAENHTARENRHYEVSPGLAKGISGVLFMLATLYEADIDISPCKLQCDKCWAYLQQSYYPHISSLTPSLFHGAAGVALTIAKSIGSGVLADNEQVRKKLVECLSLPNAQLDFANGIAGTGVATMRCSAYLPAEFYQTTLDKIITTLLSHQRQDGLWMDLIESNSPSGATLNFKYDNTGIIWFILERFSINPDPQLEKAIRKAIDGILGHRAYMKYLLQIFATQESYEVGDGGKGVIATLIHAYEVFQDIYFKEQALKLLSKYPPCIAHHNFSQENGLAGIGELYLEAWRIFGDQEWKSRAEWIAALLANCLYRIRPDSGLWVMEQNNPPTAGFLTGNSGVIHFLARCWKPDKIKYRLLK